MKYPIGIQDFERIVKDGYYYVDKTALIYRLVTEGNVYYFNRPRCFGKSLLVSTLECYFKGKKELFKGLAIESLEKQWAEYPVFHLSFGNKDFSRQGALERELSETLNHWEDVYGKSLLAQSFAGRFLYVLQAAHGKTGKPAVVLIDGYDKPLLDMMDAVLSDSNDTGKTLQEEHYRQILKGFYSVFKEADSHLQFVLLTGMTKYSQESIFSGFNQAQDISLDPRYEALCGITADELCENFMPAIEKLAVKYTYTVDEMKEKLKMEYGGYHFSDEMKEIYHPYSILNALDKQQIENFWFDTYITDYLKRLLAIHPENLNELTGRYYDPSQFIDYRGNIPMLLPLLYQSGCLTIQDVNLDMNTFLLDYPNNEVKKGIHGI